MHLFEGPKADCLYDLADIGPINEVRQSGSFIDDSHKPPLCTLSYFNSNRSVD